MAQDNVGKRKLINLLIRDCCFYWFVDSNDVCGKGHPMKPVELTGIGEDWCEGCPDYVSVEAKRN